MKRSDVLKELDIKETPAGKPVIFSIKFRSKKGELIFMPKAMTCGLNMNLKANRMRGVQAVDERGNKVGHPTPMSIDRMIEFNGSKIFL